MFSKNIQLSTVGAKIWKKFCNPNQYRRIIVSVGILWPPSLTRLATRSIAISGEGSQKNNNTI